MQETISQNYSSPNMSSPTTNPSKKKPVIIIVAVILAIILGFYFFNQSKKTTENNATVSPTTKLEPSPTDQPKIDKSTVKIQVQNGTGTPGQAGSAVDALKEAGYDANNITTANADKFDTTVTTISAKAGFEGVATDVQNALKADFSDSKIDSTKLDDTSEFDIVVVTGGKKYEPTVAPTKEATATVAPTTSDTPTPTLTTTPSATPTP